MEKYEAFINADSFERRLPSPQHDRRIAISAALPTLSGMYVVSIVLFMLVLPLASIAIGLSQGHSSVPAVAVALRWFGVWAVGGRLVSAGLRQILRPEFTARTILGLTGTEAPVLVRELGYSNFAVGLLGFGSVFFSAWSTPACAVGAVFFGLAGFRHAFAPRKTGLQTVAMVSDLYAFAVLGGLLAVRACQIGIV